MPCNPYTRRLSRRSALSLRLAAGLAVALTLAGPADASTLRGDRARAERAQRDALLQTLRARVTASWAGATSGGWFDASKWSGGVIPNNDATTQYDARIDAGGTYTVLINDDLNVSSLTLAASGATLDLFSGDVVIDETLAVGPGIFRLRDGATLTAADLALNSGLFEMNGGVLELGSTLAPSGGTFRFNGGVIRNTTIDGASTRFDISGRTGNILDNATITGGVLTLGSTQGLRIRNGFKTTDGGGIVIDGGLLEFEGTQTLTGVNLQAANEFSNEIALLAGAALTIADDMSLTGRGFRFSAPAGATLINRGSLEDVLFLPSDGHFENHGQVRQSSVEWGSWENHGLFENAGVVGGVGTNYGEFRDSFLTGDWINEGLITFSDSIGGALDGSWINNGVISGLERAEGAWVNNGEINLAPGGRLFIDADWTNAGTINIGSGEMRVFGDFATADIGVVNAADGAISVFSAWNNAGADYTLDPDASWALEGDLSGGVIRANQSALSVQRSGTLDNLDYYGDLIVEQTTLSGVTLGAGLRVLDGAILIRESGRAIFESSVLEDTDVVLETGEMRVGAAGSLLIDAQSSVRGFGGIRAHPSSSSADFINEGLIEASLTVNPTIGVVENRGSWNVTAAGSLMMSAGTFENTGDLAIGDDAEARLEGALRNSGRIDVNGGRLFVNDYVHDAATPLALRDGAIFEVAGEWDNIGRTSALDLMGGGVFIRGALRGGEVQLLNGDELVFNGEGATLDNVVVRGGDVVFRGFGEFDPSRIIGPVAIPDGALKIRDGAVVLVDDGLTIDAPLRIVNRGEIIADSLAGPGAGDLAFAQNAVAEVIGGRITAGSFVNQGEIIGADEVELPGSGGARIVAPQFRNDGAIRIDSERSNARFTLVSNNAQNNGLIELGGTLEGAFDPALPNRSAGLVNDGVLRFVDGVRAQVNTPLTNNNLLEVRDTARVELGGAWTNAGEFRIDGGSLRLGGVYDTSAIGQVTLNGGVASFEGDWDNSGATYTFGAAAGVWQLAGLVTGGELIAEPGAQLRASHATLDAVAVMATELQVGGNSTLTLTGGADVIGGRITLAPAGSILRFEDAVVIDDPIEGAQGDGVNPRILFRDPAAAEVAAAGSISGAVDLYGLASAGGTTLRNAGVIDLEAPDGSLRIEGLHVETTGVLRIGRRTTVTVEENASLVGADGVWRGELRVAEGAVLSRGSGVATRQIDENAGMIVVEGVGAGVALFDNNFRNTGSIVLTDGAAFSFGRIGVDAGLTNAGAIDLGANSDLVVLGDFIAEDASHLKMRLGDAGSSEVLVFLDAVLDGRLELTLEDPLSLAAGQRFSLVRSSAGVVSGVFDETMLPDLAGALSLTLDYTDGGVFVVVVPTPATTTLFTITALAAARRRRRTPHARAHASAWS